MSATDELRRMLDERGVHWWEGDDEHKTHWEASGLTWEYFNDENGEAWLGFLGACEQDITPEQAVEATLRALVTGDTSDGYHTFNELYHHRAVLFSVIVRDHRELAWKSKAHHDGTMFDGMFIVGIETLGGQATYHYDIDPYWDMFDCKELDRAPEWDGHTPDDAIGRIATLGRGTCHDLAETPSYRDKTEFKCSECGYEYSAVGGFGCDYGDEPDFRYCPNCGRKVVDE